MNIGDIVYIKQFSETIKNTKYEISFLNNEYAIIKKLNEFSQYRKINLNLLTKDKDKVCCTEIIKKGSLVKCITDDFKLKEGIVLSVYEKYILVLFGDSRKRISKNKAVIINA